MKAHERRLAKELAKATDAPLPAAQRAVRRFGNSYRWWRWVLPGAGILLVAGAVWQVAVGKLDVLPDALGLVVGLSLFGLFVWREIRIRALIRQERRAPSQICLNCGYDLRGIQSDRCPECGEASRGT